VANGRLNVRQCKIIQGRPVGKLFRAAVHASACHHLTAGPDRNVCPTECQRSSCGLSTRPINSVTHHFVRSQNFQYLLSFPVWSAAAQDAFNAGNGPVEIEREVVSPRSHVSIGQNLGRTNIPIDQFLKAGCRNRVARNATRAKLPFEVTAAGPANRRKGTCERGHRSFPRNVRPRSYPCALFMTNAVTTSSAGQEPLFTAFSTLAAGNGRLRIRRRL
jgi:hypothetical protein